jgi:hypothetical protein
VRSSLRVCLTLPVFVSLSAAALAQQFQHQVGMLPGTARWSEGVECADVDGDGDLDIFFADGDGFSSAGTKRQNVLLINQFIPSGTLSFTDESVARLGVRVSNAKMVITGDVNGDGWVDALYANAFDTDTPLLYINQGAANPGFFTMESATRGLTTALSSGGAQFGDVDDDGDLDLVINNGYLGQSRKPKLYLNNGAGVFMDTLASFAAAANKQAQMDVQLVDLDADWDLDFFGACRATNGGISHYLMLNNGAAVFANAPSNVPSNTASTYEGEVGDLDGDSDIDLFLVSSSGFAEGAIRSNFAPSGTFGFTQLATLADSNDDNEIALFDWDVDGDFDVLVGSLSSGSETFWRNNGALSFTNVSAASITQLTDSTLDVAVADLDNDGRYDLVTAQGESGSFVNKVYRNTGAPDILRPVVTAIDAATPASPSAPLEVHAKVRDQVLDDGVNYVTGDAHYATRTGATPAALAISIASGGLSVPNAAVLTAQGVNWTNDTVVSQTVQLTSAPHDYVVAVLAPGQSVQHVLPRPGAYTYSVTPAGHAGSIAVSGTSGSVATFDMGGAQHRVLLPDLAAGAGQVVFFELEFRDWPGNVTVTPTVTGQLQDCSVTVYCTAKVNSQFCLPAISASGIASLSNAAPLTISASNVLNQKQGLLFYGFGASATSFQGGFKCVANPLRRTPTQNSGGSGAGTDCSGAFSFDFNAWIATGNDALLQTLGVQVNAQYWSRDPQDPFTTNLTDAVQFKVCP